MSVSKWAGQLFADPFERGPMPDVQEEPADREDQHLRLKIKKRQQAQLIKQMLQDAGYEELARNTSVAGLKPEPID